MQQRFRKLALFLGAASVATGGLIMVACSSDSSAPVATPVVEAGNKDTGSAADTGTPTDGGTTGEASVDADCSKDPKLRDYTNGFRCAFSDAGGRDSGSNCTNDETCCNTEDKVGTTFQPSYCATGPKNVAGDVT
jgi:hypothetical protein